MDEVFIASCGDEERDSQNWQRRELAYLLIYPSLFFPKSTH